MVKFLKRLLVFCLVVLVIYVILIIPKVDNFITAKIDSLYTANPEPEYIINTEDMYEENESPPLTFIREERLWLLYQDRFVDITTEGLRLDSINYDINKSFELKKNCRVVSNGKHIMYILEINGESHLFRLDIENREVVEIAEKVDSFVITKRGNILYATGYLSSNYVYVYKDGQSKQIAKDAKVYYLRDHDCIIARQSDGALIRYTEFQDDTVILDTAVKELYNPFGKKHNYIDMSNSLLLYYKKATGDYVNNNGEVKALEKSFHETVPETIYPCVKDDRYFYYSKKEKTLYLMDEGYIYGIMRDVYKIFEYDKETERFVLATSKAVYLATIGETNRVDAVKMYNLKGIYKRNESMIRRHLDIVTNDFKSFYSVQISGSSFIFNFINADSWMNKISIVKYKLHVSTLQGDEFESIKELDVPQSRKLEDNLIIYDEKTYIYIPRNKKMEGSSVSFITKNITTYQNSIENEPFDTVQTYNGLDYIYFVTETTKNNVKNRLYVYENNTSIMLHRGSFKTVKALSSIYLISQNEDGETYDISIINGLTVDRVVRNVEFANES